MNMKNERKPMKSLTKANIFALVFSAFLVFFAPSLALADSAELVEGYDGSLGNNAYTAVEGQYHLGSVQKLLAIRTYTDIGAATHATLEITLTLSEDSPLIGHKPKDVLWLGGVVETADTYSKPGAFTFIAGDALADKKYTIKPVGGTNFTDADTFKEAGKYTINVQVENIKQVDVVPEADNIGNIDQIQIPEFNNYVKINLVLVAWNGLDKALATVQEPSINKYSIAGTSSSLSGDALTKPFFTPEAGLEEAQKELFPLAGQTVEITDMYKAADPKVQIDTATVVNFEIEYAFGPIAEKTHKFGVDNHFVPQFKDGDNFVSLKAADQQNSASNVALSTHGQFAIYEGSREEVQSATSPLPAIKNGDFIKRSTTYTVRYAVLSDSTNPATLNNALRLVGPKSLVSSGSGSTYLADPQADPRADYGLLYSNTFESDSSHYITGIEYGYVLNRHAINVSNTLEGSLEAPVKYLKTDIVGQEGLKFVTYKVQVEVPEYTDTRYIDLKPTIDHVKLVDYLNNGKELTRIEDEAKATEGGLFWLKDKYGNMVKGLEGGSPTPLTFEKSDYTVYYTVPVNAEGTMAESIVAVFSKTARLNNSPPALPDLRFTQFTSGPITVFGDGAPWMVEDQKLEKTDPKYAENQYILGTGVASQTRQPVQTFAYTGFSEGDAYIFKREFIFNSKADEVSGKKDTLLINKDTMRLVKYNLSNEFVGEFELIDVPVPPKNMDGLKLFDGKFWLTKNVGDGIVKTDGTEPFVEGARYYVYFVIKDDGEFDNTKDPDTPDGQKVISDPNGLFAQPRPSGGGSSGCSVGENNVYDLTLLTLFALGLVILRVRIRKA